MNPDNKREVIRLIREVSRLLNEGELTPDQILQVVLQALDQEMGFRNSMIVLRNAVLLQKYMESLSNVLPVDETISKVEATGVRLTKRETEVANLVSVGLSNDEIAEKLFVSSRTVTTHLDRIYKKLEIHSRTALAHYMAHQMK
ncbi:helix-turn-helix domain-containing protein [Brevibacillus ginsengisoli]|uniref:helix-turn-helix domain-containing protein n=1 Tax=Brevibacillus ginsengisoli TaxID=363854 RepID=UPI003CEAD737